MPIKVQSFDRANSKTMSSMASAGSSTKNGTESYLSPLSISGTGRTARNMGTVGTSLSIRVQGRKQRLMKAKAGLKWMNGNLEEMDLRCMIRLLIRLHK